MTVKDSQQWTAAHDMIEQFEETLEGLHERYGKEELRLMEAGATHVKEALFNSYTDAMAALTAVNRLLIRFQEIETTCLEAKQLKKKLSDIDDCFDARKNTLHATVAAALYNLSALNPYILKRLSLSVDYSLALYNKETMNREL